MKQLQQYTYTIPAGGSVMIPATNDNFIVQASTGPLSVRGDTFGTLRSLVAGQGLKAVPFSRLELVDESGAPNTVTLLITPAEFVNQTFSGSVDIVGGVLTNAELRAAPVPVRTVEAAGASWTNGGTFAGFQALTIFAAGANPNGAIILHMESQDAPAGYVLQTFVAKATAPATVTDGEVLAQSTVIAVAGSTIFSGIKRENPVRIPGGLGLYFVSNAAGVAGMLRNCRYILL